MADNSDEYAREVIRSLEVMTQRLVEFRQEIGRAIYPLFPRILGIERRLDEDSKDRIERQKDLDMWRVGVNAALDDLRKWRRARLVVEVALVLISIVALWWFR